MRVFRIHVHRAALRVRRGISVPRVAISRLVRATPAEAAARKQRDRPRESKKRERFADRKRNRAIGRRASPKDYAPLPPSKPRNPTHPERNENPKLWARNHFSHTGRSRDTRGPRGGTPSWNCRRSDNGRGKGVLILNTTCRLNTQQETECEATNYYTDRGENCYASNSSCADRSVVTTCGHIRKMKRKNIGVAR